MGLKYPSRDRLKAILAGGCLVVLAACGPHGGGGITATPVSPAGSVPPLQQAHDPGHVTGTLTGPCLFHMKPGGQLPDPRCTPGAYDPGITAAVLCAPGYTTRSYRPPAAETTRFKYQQAYPAYGLAATAPAELDHLVPLALGGANTASNLWPEIRATQKDRIEETLNHWVCRGGADRQHRLDAAQRAIAADWATALAVLGVS